MRRAHTIAALTGLALVAVVAAVTPVRGGPEPDPASTGAPAANAVWDVLYARPFRLAVPYTHKWRAERPLVSAGHLLVLAVDPQAVVPRQELEPVLQVGQQTAERVNAGHLDGALVVIVPSSPDADGWPSRDLTLDPIFLGARALPEQVDAAHLTAQLVATTAIPFAPERVARALARGGAALDAIDQVELTQVAARLIQGYAPSERDKADGLLVPYER